MEEGGGGSGVCPRCPGKAHLAGMARRRGDGHGWRVEQRKAGGAWQPCEVPEGSGFRRNRGLEAFFVRGMTRSRPGVGGAGVRTCHGHGAGRGGRGDGLRGGIERLPGF